MKNLFLLHRYLALSALFLFLFSLVPGYGQGGTEPILPDSLTSPIEQWRAGVYAALGVNLYAADFRALPGVPSCCPQYESGSGIGFAVGAMFEHPVADGWAAGLRVLYADYGGALRAEEVETVDNGVESVEGMFEHTIQASITGIGFEPLMIYTPTPEWQFFAGGRLDVALTNTFYQEEELVSPEDVRFENDERVRLVSEGDIPDATALYGSVVVGLRYQVPLNAANTVVAVPELSGWYGFSPVVKDIDWAIHGVRLGLSIQRIKLTIPTPVPDGPDPFPIRPDDKLPGGT